MPRPHLDHKRKSGNQNGRRTTATARLLLDETIFCT
jgi:hypothetical protein